MSVCYGFRFWEAEQQVTVVFVLLLAKLDFTGQAFSNGVGQCIEFIQDGDDSGLLC